MHAYPVHSNDRLQIRTIIESKSHVKYLVKLHFARLQSKGKFFLIFEHNKTSAIPQLCKLFLEPMCRGGLITHVTICVFWIFVYFSKKTVFFLLGSRCIFLYHQLRYKKLFENNMSISLNSGGLEYRTSQFERVF
ncbi:uncharacterized protein PHALS_14360 [Plasmopara halstedii]|uniref:Uncharacterized protein n=1 Tax=Plasmopara halstedii TaxID=4781 RepID=A0A0P1ARG1_PLAHL|nr:uncharacterized protein PHALS_14360 [Plasmopara halstedii]CEG44094.1 hypothetical protein PHALS_14360 [Plasmopara halstedii]|eukprot:XP_024580463.1 hypothetical protein PHALS_14360 [Plasmopara halstedii]